MVVNVVASQQEGSWFNSAGLLQLLCDPENDEVGMKNRENSRKNQGWVSSAVALHVWCLQMMLASQSGDPQHLQGMSEAAVLSQNWGEDLSYPLKSCGRSGHGLWVVTQTEAAKVSLKCLS